MLKWSIIKKCNSLLCLKKSLATFKLNKRCIDKSYYKLDMMLLGGLWTLKLQRKCHNEMSKLSKRQVKRQKNMDECQWYTFLNRRWISHWPWNSIICVYAKKIFKTFIVEVLNNVSSFSFLCEQSLLLPLWKERKKKEQKQGCCPVSKGAPCRLVIVRIKSL